MQNLDDLLESRKRDGEGFAPPAPRPEPTARERKHTLISVDDHFVEPPDVFEGRLPSQLASEAPHVTRDDEGIDYWHVEDAVVPLSSNDALQTWEATDWYVGPASFDTIRPAAWQPDARARDMDIAGIGAALNFPSTVFGFAGQRFMRMKNPELGFACVRAYNDWVLEDWVGPEPERFIAAGITWLGDAEKAAAEVRRNAERGFKAVAFSENPEKLGLPSLYEEYWDPFFRVCEETGTVINLHVGSSSETIIPSQHAPGQVISSLFGVNGLISTLNWIYAKVPVRFPDLKIAISEGGIGWVPMLLDRMRFDQVVPKFHESGLGDPWGVPDLTPEDVLHRNFWFTTYYDPLALRHRHEIGVDRIMFEADYPHADSTWPNTQEIVDGQLRQAPDLTDAEAAAMTHRNAAELYRHPLGSIDSS